MRWFLACALALPCVAHASPLLAPSPGGPVFTGPTSPSVSAIFWNPAAAGLMEGHHVMVSATMSLDLVSISRARIATSDGEPSATGDRSFSDQSPLYTTPGGIVGVVSDLGGSNFTLGAAGVLAFAEQVPDLDPSLGYHALREGLHGAEVIPFSVSYRATNRIYFGIGLSLLFSRLDLRFLRDSVLDGCAAAPCNVESAAAAERWSLSGEWDAFPGIVSANGGALFKLWNTWWGVSIVFPAGVDGVVQKDVDVTVLPAGASDPVTARARVTYQVPWLLAFGARRTVLGTLDLLVNLSYTRLGLHQDIDIRLLGKAARDAGLPEWLVRHRGLNDVVALEVGLEQAPARAVRLGARLRLARGAVASSAVAADRIDGPTLSLAGGLEVRPTDKLALVLGYALGLELPIDVAQSDYSPRAAIDCAASGHDLDTAACAAARDGRAIPTAAGRYSRLANQLTLGLTYDIW